MDMLLLCFLVFFFKQKTAYEMRISDWSSDVCSSDLERGMVDSERIAIIGHSMGSIAANHMLMRGEEFRAVVSKEGITSWNLDGYFDRMKSAWMWWFNAASEEDMRRKLSQKSLSLHLENVKSPVLFINAATENPDLGGQIGRSNV